MALEIGYIGEEMTVKVRQGATLGPFLATMVNPNNTPVNLTGCIIRGQVRKRPSDTTVVASWQVEITSAATGAYKFWMSDETTTTIPAGDTLTSGDSKYVHDIEMEDAQGNIHPLYYGQFLVFREVTR